MALEAVKPPWQTVRWYSPFREPLVDKTTLFLGNADASGDWSHTFTGDQGGVWFTEGLYVVIGGGSPQVTVFYE